MVKSRWLVPLSALVLITMTANAGQVKLASDHQTIQAKISAKELTHIFVEADRIYQVRGLDGAYELQQDEDNGSIYIKPSMSYQQRSFNVFLTTEQGHVYPLLLIPVDVPAESIELKPTGAAKEQALHWESQSEYEKTLVDLIAAMASATRPEGYAVVNGAGTVESMGKDIELTLYQQYRGEHLKGEILKVVNTGKSTIRLTESGFGSVGIRALAFARSILKPQQTTFLYRVLSNDQ